MGQAPHPARGRGPRHEAAMVTRLTAGFAARIDGVDITRPVDEPTWADIRAAFEEHSVLVFRGQALDDDAQIAFSRRFGGLEVTRSMNPAAGTSFGRRTAGLPPA